MLFADSVKPMFIILTLPAFSDVMLFDSSLLVNSLIILCCRLFGGSKKLEREAIILYYSSCAHTSLGQDLVSIIMM